MWGVKWRISNVAIQNKLDDSLSLTFTIHPSPFTPALGMRRHSSYTELL